jgi:DNA-binding MarR family transcriptional regulator
MEIIGARSRNAGSGDAPDLESHLGYSLRRVSNHVSGAFARALQAKHTSVAEWVVLCSVRARRGITPGELAGTLDLTRGAVSKVIDKLEGKNWIRRSTRAEDSRVHPLSVTRAGNRILPQLAKIADENDREFFAVLDARESAELRRLLDKLAEFHKIRAVPME